MPRPAWNADAPGDLNRVWIRLRSPGASAFQAGLGMRMSAGRVESGHHSKTVGCFRSGCALSVRADVLGVQCVRLQRLWQRLSLRKLLKALGDNLLVLRIGQLDEIPVSYTHLRAHETVL